MSVKQFYDRQYAMHESGEKICQQSILNLDKAKRRLLQVFNFYNISLPQNSSALDVGCGLGYYTEALHQHGFYSLGVDVSEIAIESCRKKFTGPQFRCASYPEDIIDSFDLIWAVDVSIINTFDTNVVRDFVASSFERLNPKGVLIIGWHTDFSGLMKSHANWAHLDLNTLTGVCGLQGPAIVQSRNNIINFIAICICRMVGKSAPIFFALKT